MKTINDYLDDLKDKTGSDYKSAKLLNTTRGSLSMMRIRAKIADETAIKIADALGINRTEVLMAAAIARSEGEVKQAWLAASKAAGIAASLIMATSMATTALEKEQTEGLSSFNYQVCILC